MHQHTAISLLAQQVWQANVWENKTIFRHLTQLRQSSTTEETLPGKALHFIDFFLRGKKIPEKKSWCPDSVKLDRKNGLVLKARHLPLGTPEF